MLLRQFARIGMLALVAFTLVIAPTLAHEGQEVGPYELFFGWREEPAFAGLMNGPEIFIEMHDGSEFAADTPVELQAVVTFGSATTTITFDAAWGETGHYIADMIPTMPGDYKFEITGKVGEEDVALVFDSAEGGFSSVEPVSDIYFPPMPTSDERISELEAKIADLEARLAALEEK